MTVFFTSDLHIGHAHVAQLRAEAMDPAYGLTNATAAEVIGWHDQYLAQNWDDMVTKGDVVWVLGDISAGGSRAQHTALEWIAARPGTKRLISGNHDKTHPMHRDAHKWFPAYSAVFDSIASHASRKIVVGDQSHRFLLSHLPYVGDSGPLNRYPEHRLRDLGFPLLHGHVHRTDRITRSTLHTPQVHIGLDAWDLFPVSIEGLMPTLEMVV